MDIEAIWQPAYDYQLVKREPESGTLPNRVDFFQRPVGAFGTSFVDTNMLCAGMFPNPRQFTATGIRVMVVPAWGQTFRKVTRESRALDEIMLQGGGFLELVIGSRIYLTDGPLAKFPVCFPLPGKEGVKSDLAKRIQKYQKAAEHIYYAITPLRIQPNQNFAVSLFGLGQWPVISEQVRIGVILDGFQTRHAY